MCTWTQIMVTTAPGTVAKELEIENIFQLLTQTTQTISQMVMTQIVEIVSTSTSLNTRMD